MLAQNGGLVVVVAFAGAPDLDEQVAGRGDEGGVVLGEGNVVDPMGMSLCLGAGDGSLDVRACGRFGFLGAVVVRGGGRVFGFGGRLCRLVEVQVPGADYAIATTRVPVKEKKKKETSQSDVEGGSIRCLQPLIVAAVAFAPYEVSRLSNLQNAVLTIDSEAIDTETVA